MTRRGLASALVALALLANAALPGGEAIAQAGFDLQAHRGGRGLRPENTLPAFEHALSLGVNTLETDLAVTADDVLVLSHDRRLNPDLTRGPDGAWLSGQGAAIRTLTLAELRRYDVGRLDPGGRYGAQWTSQQAVDGARVPTLAELIERVKRHPAPVRLNLETKLTPDSDEDTPPPEDFARRVIDAVRAAGLLDRVTLQSFDWRTLVAAKRLAPTLRTACLTMESTNLNTVRTGADGASPWHAGLRAADHGASLPRLVKAAGCDIWSMFWRNLTPELLAEARSLGLGVLPWTVNEPADMQRFIDWKVDGLITDYPDRLREVMFRNWLPLPPAGR